MAIAEMKQVVEEVISSYKFKVMTIGLIINDTHQAIDDFRIKARLINNHLREVLSKKESLRRKDFDNMMKDIHEKQDEKEKELRELLNTYLTEQMEMAGISKKAVLKGDSINDFREVLKALQRKQEQRAGEVSKVLKDFQKEQEETIRSLHSLLNKGEGLRLKDFKEVLNKIRARQNGAKHPVDKKINKKGGDVEGKKRWCGCYMAGLRKEANLDVNGR